MRNKLSNAVIGIIFIGMGLIFLGNVLDWWGFSIFFDGWWTLFLIVPAILGIINHGVNVGNLIFLGIGGTLLLSAQDIIEYRMVWKICAPLGLILIGVGIIFGGSFKSGHKPCINKDGCSTNETAVLGGREPNYANIEFKGTNCTAILGGVDLNLRSAIINQDCQIVCYCVMGGIDILLPPNVRVLTNVTPILGGIENKYVSTPNENAPTVSIIGTVIMGGIDIK